MRLSAEWDAAKNGHQRALVSGDRRCRKSTSLTVRSVCKPSTKREGNRDQHGSEYYWIPRMSRPAKIGFACDERDDGHCDAYVQERPIFIAKAEYEADDRQYERHDIREPVKRAIK